jgi:hypothetical protein
MATKRGWNIHAPRLKQSASTVENALETMPMPMESKMPSIHFGSSISAR